MIFEIWYCLKAISHYYWMGLVEQVYFGGRLCDSAKSERERETLWLLLFDCLKVLKENVYRIRFKTEILLCKW